MCYAEKKSECLLKNIQLIAFDTLLFLKFFSRFLAFLLHLFFCFLQLGSQCSLAGVSRSTNRLRSRSRRDSTLDNGKPTCSYCFPCGKLFPFCTYHLLTHGSTPGEPTGTQKKWYRFDISFFPHGRGELLSFGNDFAGPRGHTYEIWESFGSPYIALDQRFFVQFYFISMSNFNIILRVFIRPPRKELFVIHFILHGGFEWFSFAMENYFRGLTQGAADRISVLQRL